MKDHAKKLVTLSLKVNGWHWSICYEIIIIIVILDLEYVEIDT